MLLLLHPPFLSPQQITPFNTIRCGPNLDLEDGKSGTDEQWKYSRRICLLGPWFLHLAQDFRKRQKCLSISSTAFNPKSPVLSQAGFIHLKFFVSWKKLVCVNMKFFLTAAGHTGFTDPSLVGRDGATTSGEQVCGGSRTGNRCQTPALSLPALFYPNGQSNPRLNISLSCATFLYEAFTPLKKHEEQENNLQMAVPQQLLSQSLWGRMVLGIWSSYRVTAPTKRWHHLTGNKRRAHVPGEENTPLPAPWWELRHLFSIQIQPPPTGALPCPASHQERLLRKYPLQQWEE